MTRLLELERSSFDVIIIGGGIIGTGIARDAALRGFKVALFEKSDFGSGTTSGSTRLIHGGLRYLEMLDFRLVRIDLRERETLLRIAPHLVKPLQFLVPFYDRSLFYRLKMEAGMVLYDLLSFDKTLPRHRFLNAQQMLALEPHLRSENLQGGAVYYDAQANSPERLCVENLVEAEEHGARLFNYHEVTSAVYSGDRITGVRVRDTLDAVARELEVQGKVVVNASGPWFDRVAARLTAPATPQIRTTKGIHITCPPVSERAIVLFSPIDNRLFFTIPWMGYSWIGTTDTDFNDDPGKARATSEDVDYLINSAVAYFPSLDYERITFSNAGVRALVMEEGSESSVSRMHRITDGAANRAPGLISVLGGKLTGYRAVAEEVTDMVSRTLGNNQRCQTAELPLPGARPVMETLEREGVDKETCDHLTRLYGTRAVEVLRLLDSDRALSRKLSPNYPDIAAEVIFAVRSERCVRTADFIWRRSLLGFSHDQGAGVWSCVTEIMGQELGWSSTTKVAEMENCRQHAERTQLFRHGDSNASPNQNESELPDPAIAPGS